MSDWKPPPYWTAEELEHWKSLDHTMCTGFFNPMGPQLEPLPPMTLSIIGSIRCCTFMVGTGFMPDDDGKVTYCNRCGLPHRQGECGRRKCKRCGKDSIEYPPNSQTGRERPYCIPCTNYIEWATS